MTHTIDNVCINTIRVLAGDITRKSNSGHPGAPMGCAPMTHVLFSKHINANPSNPKWFNRDRFVLSNGHACALQYTMLHLLGYQVSMEDLKQFRQLDSITPGHPENYMTPGIEVTTGPLGQGIANAVGLAMAQAHLAALFNRDGFELVNNYTYFIVGDGCLQEGVSGEAASLAGHLQLGNLIGLYDDNHITIDGDTDVSFTEDVVKRFESYGWQVLTLQDGDHDLAGLDAAISAAKLEKNKPTLIKIRTTIGYGSKLQGQEKVHGSPLDAEDIKQVKAKFGFDPEATFQVPDEVYAFYREVAARGAEKERQWTELLQRYAEKYPEEAAELQRRIKGELPAGWEKALPSFTAADKPVATRKLSEMVLTKLVEVLPELVGGSADLTGSNLTRWSTAVDFQPPSSGLGNYSGRYVRYGVREHGMAAIMNGMAAYGGIIPYGGTFLNFITYAWGAVRLSALSHLQTIYVMTHDSIGLGEDGPTHQPIETLALCRATPNMLVMRPADGNETSGCYAAAILNRSRPSVLALSRQNLPHFDGSSIEKAMKGGYVLKDSSNAQVILAATGSEVSICMEAAKLLEGQGVSVRVVSVPCMELFEEQPLEYKQQVFPAGVPVVSVEAMTTFGWQKYAHAPLGMTTFGASGPYLDVYKKFGLYPEAIAEKSLKVINYYRTHPVPNLLEKSWE
ncbi:uncharacterized protein VTP21DRAFT_3108 [Calcarisporiella thermophila]|uniref:uncharacterized protein n=1 Tax=Calcarisporiella thermophila TaxID=911321 RepID=UPI003744B159